MACWLYAYPVQHVFEDEKPIYCKHSFWVVIVTLLMASLVVFNLRTSNIVGPGVRKVPPTWRPSWRARKSSSSHYPNSIEAAHGQTGDEHEPANQAEQARYIRHQTEFDPPPDRMPSPPRILEPSHLLKRYRHYYDTDFPRHGKNYEQGKWLLDRRTVNHECSNPYLFDDMEDSSIQEKKQSNIWGRGTVILYLSDNLTKTSCSPIQLEDVLYIRNSHFTNHHTLSLAAISDTVKLCNYGTARKHHTTQLIERNTGRWLGEVKKDWVFKNEKDWIVQTCLYNTEHEKTIDPVFSPNHGWWPRLIR